MSFIWLHPQFVEFPDRLQELLIHARNFSEALHGAALLYNLMLAEEIKNDELVTRYLNRISTWHQEIQVRGAAWTNWDRNEFWALLAKKIHIPLLMERFVTEWINRLLSDGKVANPTGNQNLREMVRLREMRLKGKRSRFLNRRHLEIWSGDSGTGQLDYRWYIARNHSNDILNGLRSGS